MKNQRLLERKQELKQLTLDGRAYRKKWGSGCTPYSREARFKHIAYCMARGKKYEQIEQKVHKCNEIHEYYWKKIEADIEYLKEGFNEDVRASA